MLQGWWECGLDIGLGPPQSPRPHDLAPQAPFPYFSSSQPQYLEESADFRKLRLGAKEAEGQHGAHVLRYGVEMRDEAVGHLGDSQAEAEGRGDPRAEVPGALS